ncbi:MAG: NAD(P)/FAD-dependent oxidoreductase [Nanoarchaeota archaeon]|nr:MAG: NAD(P)/FAD-dependent oxidoreductase [Nanoarchaeota archaeon]
MYKKQLVILGGGFAGVILAQKLLCTRMAYDVTLVDKNNYFSFTPMIVETVSGTNNPYNIVQPLRQIFNHKINIVKETVRGVDLDRKLVRLQKGTLHYDILIMTLGSIVEYYGIPGAKKYSLPLRTVENGIEMRRRIINAFETGKSGPDHTFIVIGGGPTGVELAGEVEGLISNELRKQFPRVKSKVILVEKNNQMLVHSEPYISKKATEILKRKNIELLLNRKVIEIKKDSIVLDTGTIRTTNVFWAAGMRASEVRIVPEPKKDKMNRIIVDEQFKIPGHKDVYVIGDMASYIDPRIKKPFHMAAQVAEKEAFHLAKQLCGGYTKPFVFKEQGFLVSIGRFDGVASMLGIKFTGFPAWFAWRTIYLFKLRSLRKKIRVAYDWTISLFYERDTSEI